MLCAILIRSVEQGEKSIKVAEVQKFNAQYT